MDTERHIRDQLRLEGGLAEQRGAAVKLWGKVDVTTLKIAKKPVKIQKENPAGYAGEGKQNKGN